MTLPLGKHSGRHAFARACAEAGHALDREEVDAAFERFKRLADLGAPRHPRRRLPGGASMNMQDRRLPRRRRRRPRADGRRDARARARVPSSTRSSSTTAHLPFAGEAVTRSGHPLPPSHAGRLPRRRRDPRRVAATSRRSTASRPTSISRGGSRASSFGTGGDIVVVGPVGEWANEIAMSRAFACAAVAARPHHRASATRPTGARPCRRR